MTGIAGDQQAALFGQACFAPGRVKATYGTGSFVLANAGTARPEPADGVLATAAWRLGRRRRPSTRSRARSSSRARRCSGCGTGSGSIADAAETEALARSVDGQRRRLLRPGADGPRLAALGAGRARPDHRPDARDAAGAPRPRRARGDRVPDARRRRGDGPAAGVAARGRRRRGERLPDAVPGGHLAAFRSRCRSSARRRRSARRALAGLGAGVWSRARSSRRCGPASRATSPRSPPPSASGCSRAGTTPSAARWRERLLPPLAGRLRTCRRSADGRRRGVADGGAPAPQFARVLDVPCGSGRHLRALMALGYEVTGVDSDPVAVAEAGAGAAVGDLRTLDSLPSGYDAVINLWASFGYFGAEENERVLAGLARRLRGGGRLVLDVYNRAFFASRSGERELLAGHRRALRRWLPGAATARSTTAKARVDAFEWQLYVPEELHALGSRQGLAPLVTIASPDGADAMQSRLRTNVVAEPGTVPGNSACPATPVRDVSKGLSFGGTARGGQPEAKDGERVDDVLQPPALRRSAGTRPAAAARRSRAARARRPPRARRAAGRACRGGIAPTACLNSLKRVAPS